MSLIKQILPKIHKYIPVVQSPVKKAEIITGALKESFKDSNFKVAIIRGKHYATAKVTNYRNLRVYRFEIPESGLITVHALHRTHNIIEDIDEFYKSDFNGIIDVNVHVTFEKLWSDIQKGRYNNQWINEEVDRSEDVEVAMCYLRESLNQFPKDNYVLYNVIKSVVRIDPSFDSDEGYDVELELHGIPDTLTLENVYLDDRLYMAGNIVVVNSAGKVGVFKRTKARKFLRFKKTEWLRITREYWK